MDKVGRSEEPHETAIRRARENSNRAIARRNLLGVGDSLAEDYVGVIGDGTFVGSRAEYLRLFKAGFDRPKQGMLYVRTPDIVNVAEDETLAAEHGKWVATLASGEVAYTGSYAASGVGRWTVGRSGQKCSSLCRVEASAWTNRIKTFGRLVYS